MVKSKTPGYRAVLVSDASFEKLKSLQSYRTCGHLPVRFDLKDIASAVIDEAMTTPDFTNRVLRRALDSVRHNIDIASSLPASPSILP